MIKFLLQAWELVLFIEVCRYFISVVFARLTGQSPPPLPARLTQVSNSPTVVKRSFYPASELAFVELLEANCHPILSEFQQLHSQGFISLTEQSLQDKGWSTFNLYRDAVKIEENCRLCPETTQLVARLPNLWAVSFLTLAPDTQVTCCSNYADDILRCHLGLVVPDRCTIQVGEEQQIWHEGRCLIFSCTTKHRLQNDSTRFLSILQIDFKSND
jgi:beta-hydroxylase